jgi:hypothetical protein
MSSGSGGCSEGYNNRAKYLAGKKKLTYSNLLLHISEEVTFFDQLHQSAHLKEEYLKQQRLTRNYHTSDKECTGQGVIISEVLDSLSVRILPMHGQHYL